jgi:PGF-pre-PGF domain-containing protein
MPKCLKFGLIWLDFLLNMPYNTPYTCTFVHILRLKMTESQKFGTRLRELRTQAGLSLRELASQVNVDFTYLSKIENGALPPPSDKVIRQLAETLHADKDEMLTLAGKIPPDIAEILKDRETLKQLRADRARKEATSSSQSTASMPKVSTLFKGLYRLALPVFLVIAVAASLWYASPTKALTIDITNPASGTLGSTHRFYVTVNIEDQDLIPIKSINICIFKNGTYTSATSPYKATLANLPLISTTKYYTSAQTGGGAATVTAVASGGWTAGYTYGTAYAAWKGGGYSFTPAKNFGYGYGGSATYMEYTVDWTSPSSAAWAGSYKIESKLIAVDNQTFTETSSSTFTLSAQYTGGPVAGGGGGGAPPKAEKLTAEELEKMTTQKAAETIEELTAEEAAKILEEVSTDKAAEIIEEISTDKAAAIIEKLSAQKATDIIEKISAQKAADIIEKISTQKAADIIEKISTQKAADIIEKLTAEKAAAILEKVSKDKAAAIMEQLPTERLTDIIAAMSEASLTERLPGLSVDKLYSIEPAVLFATLPNAPTEQLVSEEPPQPPAGLDEPVVVYTTPTGAKYLAVQTMAGEWVVVMGTPEPIDRLMIKTNKALQDVGTTLEVSEQKPPEALIMLPAGQIARAYATISFENAAPEDIELGHMTFKVEKEWLEQNSVHKWSVALYRYDPELNRWIALPTKRVKEDDTYVYYTVVITRFSVFAISGSQAVLPPTLKVTNLEISPAEAESGADITISADVTNTSDSAATYAITLWINGTAEAGKDVSVPAGRTESVSFTTNRTTAGSYEARIDRLLADFNVTKPTPKPTPSVTEPTPEATPKPTTPVTKPTPEATPEPTTPEIPVTPINWWLIGGIIAAVIIIAVIAWQLVARRQE